jgi:hypothetical protein
MPWQTIYSGILEHGGSHESQTTDPKTGQEVAPACFRKNGNGVQAGNLPEGNLLPYRYPGIPDSHDVGLSKRLRFVHTIKYFRVA